MTHDKPRVSPLFLTLITAFLVVGAFVWFNRGPAEAVAQESASRIERWETELFASEAEPECSTESDEFWLGLPARLEQARVDPAQKLILLRRIRRSLRCDPPEGQRGSELRGVASDLQAEISRRLRAHHARILRAVREQQDAVAHAEVSRLRALLAHHIGPLSETLDSWERSYRPGPGAAGD